MFDKREFIHQINKLNSGIIFYFYNDVWPVCYGRKEDLKLPNGWIRKEGNILYNIKEDISLEIVMLKDYLFPRPHDIIDKNDHYYLLMHPLKFIASPYNGNEFLEIKNNLPEEKWVECKITEDRYKVSSGYLIEFEPLEEGYGHEIISYDSFLYDIGEGLIVKKENDMECVFDIWNEPLYKDLYLKHSGYVLKKVKKFEVNNE